MIFRIHVHIDTYFTPNYTFAFAFVIQKVINSEIILFRAALISVSMAVSFFLFLGLRNPFPLTAFKTPRTPNLSKICPSDCFWGFQAGGQKFVKNLSKFEERQFSDKF